MFIDFSFRQQWLTPPPVTLLAHLFEHDAVGSEGLGDLAHFGAAVDERSKRVAVGGHPCSLHVVERLPETDASGKAFRTQLTPSASAMTHSHSYRSWIHCFRDGLVLKLVASSTILRLAQISTQRKKSSAVELCRECHRMTF